MIPHNMSPLEQTTKACWQIVIRWIVILALLLAVLPVTPVYSAGRGGLLVLEHWIATSFIC